MRPSASVTRQSGGSRGPYVSATASGTRSATRQAHNSSVRSPAPAAQGQLRPAEGEHVPAKLRPPFQPVGGAAHPGPVEQLLAQRLGFRLRGLGFAGVGWQQQPRP